MFMTNIYRDVTDDDLKTWRLGRGLACIYKMIMVMLWIVLKSRRTEPYQGLCTTGKAHGIKVIPLFDSN